VGAKTTAGRGRGAWAWRAPRGLAGPGHSTNGPGPTGARVTYVLVFLVGPLLAAKCPADVLHKQHQVEVVGRAWLEVGHQVQVKVASLFGLRVDQEPPAPDVG
jgi:hypothetical protein